MTVKINNEATKYTPEWFEPIIIILLLANPIVIAISPLWAGVLLSVQAVVFAIMIVKSHMEPKQRFILLTSAGVLMLTVGVLFSVMWKMPLDGIEPTVASSSPEYMVSQTIH